MYVVSCCFKATLVSYYGVILKVRFIQNLSHFTFLLLINDNFSKVGLQDEWQEYLSVKNQFYGKKHYSDICCLQRTDYWNSKFENRISYDEKHPYLYPYVLKQRYFYYKKEGPDFRILKSLTNKIFSLADKHHSFY
jgi:hypothetical protein